MKDNVEAYVRAFFQSALAKQGLERGDIMAVPYIEDKVLDSFGVVTMITDFEAKFGIRFSIDDLQSEGFKTVGGVVSCIQAKL